MSANDEEHWPEVSYIDYFKTVSHFREKWIITAVGKVSRWVTQSNIHGMSGRNADGRKPESFPCLTDRPWSAGALYLLGHKVSQALGLRATWLKDAF